MIDLEHLKRICEAATPGPWYVSEDAPDTVFYDAAAVSLFVSNYGTDPTCEPADANFIAAARTALPELIARIEKLEAEARQ